MEKIPHDFTIRTLEKTSLFRDATKLQRAAVAQIAVPLSVRRGELIARQGKPSPGFFVIVSGTVNVHRIDREGIERGIRMFQAGESFAEASLLPEGVYPAGSRAETDCHLLLIPRAGLLDLLRHDPDFALGMVASLSARLHALVAIIEKFREHNVRERLADWILTQKPQAGNPMAYTVRIPGSKAGLATMLGTRPETLSRHLAALRASGLIEVRGREITVPDAAAFARLAAGSAGCG